MPLSTIGKLDILATDSSCGISEGLLLTFDRVILIKNFQQKKVTYQLNYNKTEQKLDSFCLQYGLFLPGGGHGVRRINN